MSKKEKIEYTYIYICIAWVCLKGIRIQGCLNDANLQSIHIYSIHTARILDHAFAKHWSSSPGKFGCRGSNGWMMGQTHHLRLCFEPSKSSLSKLKLTRRFNFSKILDLYTGATQLIILLSLSGWLSKDGKHELIMLPSTPEVLSRSYSYESLTLHNHVLRPVQTCVVLRASPENKQIWWCEWMYINGILEIIQQISKVSLNRGFTEPLRLRLLMPKVAKAGTCLKKLQLGVSFAIGQHTPNDGDGW